MTTGLNFWNATAAGLAALWLGGATGWAGELKVDIGPTGRPNQCAPHFTEWAFQPGKPSPTFGGVTVRLQALTGQPDALAAGLYKFGLDYDARLVCDGVYLTGAAAGGGLEMVLAGLPPGRHTLATYHNSFWPAAKSPGAFNILADGVLVASNLVPTIQATNDYTATAAYFSISASAGQDVVVRFIPAGPAAVTNIVLDGFEIDAANPNTKATDPWPANDEEHFNGDDGTARLTWRMPAGAVAQRVYFGTNAEAVAAAAVGSALDQGAGTAASFLATHLDSANTYFWRVDEQDAAGVVTRGELWRFRPRHLAFPTAEGYGRFARGGRGGRVVEVTNLEDYNPDHGEAVIPGSFRAAVEATGPRTIVFRVCGVIRLKKPCAVHNP
jgi:hypothetical protein